MPNLATQQLTNAQIAEFYNGSYVDTTATTGEANRLQAALVAGGHQVTTFTGITAADLSTALSGKNVLVIPELEGATLTLAADARAVVRDFVSSGHSLIISGTTSTRDTSLLNSIFGFNLQDGSQGGGTKTPSATGTTFSSDVSTLPGVSATADILKVSLPSDSLSLYESGANTSVAVIGYGSGQISYLGWDFFDAQPTGSTDGGWLAVLNSAVSLPKLLVIANQSGEYTIAQTNSGGNTITLNNAPALNSGIGTPQVDTVIYSVNQPLTLPDNIENIVLSGSGGGFPVTGNALDNTFTINAGSWAIDGVSGNDIVTFSTSRAAHTIVQNANGSLTISGPEGTEQISHVGTINFSDSRIALDTSTNAMEVARLFDAALHRQADIGGANAFVGALNGGATPLALAQGLLNSAEGQQNYAPSLTNAQFVAALYATVLGRPADAGGQAAYENALNSGASRASILLTFADSAEHQAHIGVVGQGVFHDIPLA